MICYIDLDPDPAGIVTSEDSTEVKTRVGVFWTPKMEALRSPEMFVSYRNTTWCHNPEDFTSIQNN
jgi:hypothetical protein